jgi:hypothetical protein
MVQEEHSGMAIPGGNLSNYGRDLRVSLYPTRGNLCKSKTYKLELTFIKACSDLLSSHQGSVIMLGWHSNMEVL